MVANIISLLALVGIWQWVSNCTRGLCTVEGIYFVHGLMFSVVIASAIAWKTVARLIAIVGVFSLGYAIYDGNAAQRTSEVLFYITEPQAVDVMLVGGNPEEVFLPSGTDIREEFLLVRAYLVDGVQFYATTFSVLCLLQTALFIRRLQRREEDYDEPSGIYPDEPVIVKAYPVEN